MADRPTTPSSGDGTAIYDLGHKAYTGPRRPASQRFLPITRNVWVLGWRAKWGVKAPVALSGIATLIAAVIIVILGGQITQKFTGGIKLPLPSADIALFTVLPSYIFTAVIVALNVGCAASAEDFPSGAFQFYFSRAIRLRDYVIGKLLGVSLLVGMTFFVGPVVLAVVRISLAENASEVWKFAPVLPKSIILGALGTLTFSSLALGAGALMEGRRSAQVLYLSGVILGSLAAKLTADLLDSPWPRMLAIDDCLMSFGRHMAGLPPDIMGEPLPWWAALASLLMLSAMGIAVFAHKVQRNEASGIGGGG